MYNIAVIPGDGIGREVVPEGIRALVQAIERILGESDTKTPDLGGIATTTEVGEANAAEARALVIF